MVYTNSTHLLSLQLVLWMKTRRLLWLHTTFKWTLCRARQNQQDYRDLDWGQNSGKSNKWRLLYAVSGSSSVCFSSVTGHVSLKAARIIRLGLIVYVFISGYHSVSQTLFSCALLSGNHTDICNRSPHEIWLLRLINIISNMNKKQTLNRLCVVYHLKKVMNIFATVSTGRGD